jgi:uncharacterized protein (TIGR02453 family)
MTKGSPLDVRAAMRFLRGLRDHNTRDWFTANRGVYDEKIKPQFEDLVAVLLIAASRYEPRFAYVDPRSCIFRIYRDIRFSNDKTPYKAHLSAFLSPRGWRGSTPGFYVGLEPGGESVMSAGVYVPEKPALTAIRRRIAEGDRDLDRILRAKRLQPYLPVNTDPLKRIPPGFDRDHPRSDLIRARRYMVRRPFTDAELTRGNAFALFRDAMRDTAPFVAWLDQFVTRAAPPDDWDED